MRVWKLVGDRVVASEQLAGYVGGGGREISRLRFHRDLGLGEGQVQRKLSYLPARKTLIDSGREDQRGKNLSPGVTDESRRWGVEEAPRVGHRVWH